MARSPPFFYFYYINLYTNIQNTIFTVKKDSLLIGKRGQLGFSGPLGVTVATVFALFVIGIMVFAFAIAGAEMKDVTTDATAVDVINKTVEGTQAFANFSPVLWIITAIGALLAILIAAVGGFAYYSMRR